MLQLLILLQGWVPRCRCCQPNVSEYSVWGVVFLAIFLSLMLLFGLAALADLIDFLRKKSKRDTPNV